MSFPIFPGFPVQEIDDFSCFPAGNSNTRNCATLFTSTISESLKNQDVLVACQPVISDGRLAPVLAQEWEHCVVLWATPEEQSGKMISGNSLVIFTIT